MHKNTGFTIWCSTFNFNHENMNQDKPMAKLLQHHRLVHPLSIRQNTLFWKKIQSPNNFKNLNLNNMLFRNIMLTVFEEGESPDGFKVGQCWGRRFGGRGGGGAGGKKFVWRSKIIQWMVSNQTIWIIIPLFTLCSIYSNYASGAEQILKQIVQIKHNRDNNLNWLEANLFTSMVEDLNSGLLWTNLASGQGRTWTQALPIAGPVL